MKKKAFNYTNTYAYNLALADVEGIADFYITKSRLASSLLAPLENRGLPELYNIVDNVNVNTTTLDLFSQTNSITHIDFLKIDTQGSELLILKGSENLLKEQRINLIYCEVEFYKDQCLYHDIALYLEGYGYELFSLYNLSYNKNGQIQYADALFKATKKIKQ